MPADVTTLSPEYLSYIHSPAWAHRRALYYRTHPRRCAACGNPRVELHHLTYDRLGHEDPRDLIPLCDFHHRQAHDIRDMGVLTLAEATSYVIMCMRAQLQAPRVLPPVRSPWVAKPVKVRLRSRVWSFLTGPSRPHL